MIPTRVQSLKNAVPFLVEREEDGRAEVGRDGARHGEVGARGQLLHEGAHGEAGRKAQAGSWPPPPLQSACTLCGADDHAVMVPVFIDVPLSRDGKEVDQGQEEMEHVSLERRPGPASGEE